MVLNMADFYKFCKSLQTLWNGSKTLPNWFLTPCTTVSVDFGWIRKARKLADFEQKAWAIAHGFEHGRFWQVLQIAPNTLKRFQTLPNWFLTTCTTVSVENSQGSKIGRFWAKSLIAHGFEHGRFWQVLQIAPNTLKRFQNPPKLIFNSLHDCFRRFRVNSQGSKIGRFWAKSLGYSPWFWTWPILTSSANRSKHSETVPKPSQTDF